jgi:hypothetical protein
MNKLTSADKETPFIEVLYEEEFPDDSIVINPSTYFGQFVVDHKKFNINFPLHKGQYFLVYGDSTQMSEGAYVVPVLIDADYPEEPFYSVFNSRSEPLILKKVSFIIYVCSKTFLSRETETFKLPLIRQVERNGSISTSFDSDEQKDKIIELRKSSTHANGLDLVFDEHTSLPEYQIRARETFKINIAWTPSFKEFYSASPRL